MEMVAQQKEALDRLVQAADQSFREKQAASTRRDWCHPIPAQRKVDAVQAFLKAFHDEDTVEIATCSVCYMKKSLVFLEIEPVDMLPLLNQTTELEAQTQLVPSPRVRKHHHEHVTHNARQQQLGVGVVDLLPGGAAEKGQGIGVPLAVPPRFHLRHVVSGLPVRTCMRRT